MTNYIKKSSGLKEPFNEQKIIRSLQQIGADKNTIQEVLTTINKQYPKIKNTQQVFNIALEILKQINVGMASRYNLKKALLAFGPAGYPFEQFVGELFTAQGYQVSTNVIADGFCVQHELDVVAIKNNIHHIIECKFHNRQKYKSDLKVSMYAQARFEDLQKAWKDDKSDTHETHKAWIVTNTNFTLEAIKYARCVQTQLMSWKYPKNHGLRELIKKYNLHPITALVNLTGKQKKAFLKKDIVLCSDIKNNKQILHQLGFSTKAINKLTKEAEQTCTID